LRGYSISFFIIVINEAAITSTYRNSVETLGHTSIKTTQIYAKAIEQKVSDDMK